MSFETDYATFVTAYDAYVAEIDAFKAEFAVFDPETGEYHVAVEALGAFINAKIPEWTAVSPDGLMCIRDLRQFVTDHPLPDFPEAIVAPVTAAPTPPTYVNDPD